MADLPPALMDAKYPRAHRDQKFVDAGVVLLDFVMNSFDPDLQTEPPDTDTDTDTDTPADQKPALKKRKYTKRKQTTATGLAKSQGRKKQKGGTSSFRGVSLKKKSGKWIAQLNRQGDYWSGGLFDNELEAAAAVYDHLGEEQIATKLRAMVRQGLTKVEWFCESCGAGYRGKAPDQCGKCQKASFTPLTKLSREQLLEALAAEENEEK